MVGPMSITVQRDIRRDFAQDGMSVDVLGLCSERTGIGQFHDALPRYRQDEWNERVPIEQGLRGLYGLVDTANQSLRDVCEWRVK